MERITAFDVAGSLLRRASSEELSSLKLQKLVFYSFGWFSHLTAQELFEDEFFAMSYGPVVSPLLSAHQGLSNVTLHELEEKRSCNLDVNDHYVEAVIDAVWESYGRYNSWDLVNMTHEEEPWKDAWESRPSSAKRNDLRSEDIVSHFAQKRSAEYAISGRSVEVPVLRLLPDRRISLVQEAELDEMRKAIFVVPESHQVRAADLRRRFMTV